MLNTAVLVLNRNFQPVHVTNVKRAFSLLYQGVARALDEQDPRPGFSLFGPGAVGSGPDPDFVQRAEVQHHQAQQQRAEDEEWQRDFPHPSPGVLRAAQDHGLLVELVGDPRVQPDAVEQAKRFACGARSP